MYKAKKSGTARNGFERDRGVLVHIVTDNKYPSWSKALCGTSPRGNGWHYEDESREITCTKCREKYGSIQNPKPPSQ